MRESFTERYKRLMANTVNSPTYHRGNYARRLRGILILAYMVVLLPVAYLIAKHLGISHHLASAIAGITAIAVAILHAERKADSKFKEKK